MTALFGWLDGAAGVWIPFAMDVALKSAVILLAALAATCALRRASASLRHHVWTLAFTAVLALPALAGTLPSWRVAVPGWGTAAAVRSAPDASARAGRAPVVRRGGDGAAAPGSDRGVASPSGGAAPSVRAADEAGSAPPFGSAGRLALGVWLAGAVLFLGRLVVGVVSAWWTSRVAVPIEDPRWHETVAELKDELGIAGEIRLLRSAWVGTPMAWGLLRPALLLPDEALAWSADRRRAVALHELAHVKRRDCLVHLVAQATRAVHWVNPLAWLGAKRIRAERERACDDLVITSGTRSADYARLLLDVARARGDRRLAWAAVSMARPSELEGRLLAILDPARDRRGLGRAGSLAATVAAVAMALPLAAFQAVPTIPAPPHAPTATSSPRGAVGTPAAPPEAERPPSPGPATTPRAEPVPHGAVDADRPARERAPKDVEAMDADAASGAAGALQAPRATRRDTTEERLVGVMARALRHDRADFRARAAHTLGTLESHLGVEPLSAAIDDESAEVRSEVAWALGMIESPDGVPALTVALRDGSANVRSQAAWALGMIESPDGVPALAGAIDDESREVRSQAAWALGMIESPDGVAPLLRALGDESDDVRAQAAWGLGMIESSEAVSGLIDALRGDDSAEVRSQAAWALGMIEDRAATEALIDALEDENEDVAKQAMWALGMVIR